MSLDKNEAARLTYEQLNEQVRSRENSMTTVMSILLPSSLILATLSIDPNIRENAKRIFPFFGAAVLSGGAAVLGIFAILYWWTGEAVDNVFWNHIHTLEDQLGIMEGHKRIRDELRGKRIYRLRRVLFPMILVLVSIAYVVLSLLSP